MSVFLTEFMQFALRVTKADRALAVDHALNAVGSAGLDEKTLGSPSFTDLAAKVLDEAISTHAPFITNNVIADLAEAPKTNTSFSDLRIVVGFPVGDLGGVYLDRSIKFGVVSRDLMEKLTAFAKEVADSGAVTLTADELLQHYNAR